MLPSIQQDFYSFLQRLQQHFVLSEDFNEAAAKRGSRQLQALLHARISLVCLYNKGSPLSARRSIQERVGLLHFLLQLFFFFIPWFVFTCCNCMQLLVFCSQGPWLLPQETAAAAAAAAATTAAAAAGTEMNAPQALQLQQQALASEAASGHIICCFILNASAALYLIILQSNCLQRCFTNCLYSRVHAAIVDLCNRLVRPQPPAAAAADAAAATVSLFCLSVSCCCCCCCLVCLLVVLLSLVSLLLLLLLLSLVCLLVGLLPLFPSLPVSACCRLSPFVFVFLCVCLSLLLLSISFYILFLAVSFCCI